MPGSAAATRIWGASDVVGEKPPYVRGGTVLGSNGKVAGLAVRFLAPDMRLTGAKAAGVLALTLTGTRGAGTRDYCLCYVHWAKK